MTADDVRGTARGGAPVPLSVLDLMTVGAGQDAGDAVRTAVDLARLADGRGFHRYWVAEHHSMPGIASSSPAVVLAHLAAHTDRLRLGSGGVMLPNHAPLVVAEQFGTLEAMAPGRIDLGLGRAPGTDGATAAALRTGRPGGADDFPGQLAELVAFLDGAFPDDHPYRRVHAVPGPVQAALSGTARPAHRPPVWLLGSSGYGASLAGALGLPFAFAHHFAARHTVEALDLYRRSFRPSALLAAPYALISVSVLAGEDEDEVRRQMRASSLNMVRVRSGRPGLVPTPEEAEAYRFSAAEQEFIDAWNTHVVYGTPDRVRAGLDALHARTGADELMLTTSTHGADARLRSYALIADAYGMPAPGGEVGRAG